MASLKNSELYFESNFTPIAQGKAYTENNSDED